MQSSASEPVRENLPDPAHRGRSRFPDRAGHDSLFVMRFTLKHLQYFVAAAEAGSIKLASERINISQPSISSAISHLEKELNLQLFVRHHAQGLALTRSGKRMMREAKLLLRQTESLYNVAGELRDEVRGRLSIGCMVTLAPMIIPELGHSFTKAHPDVQLALSEGSHEQLLTSLREVEIDAAISYDLGFPDDVSFEPLASLPPQVMLAADHRLAGKDLIDLEDLADEPMILLDLPHSRQYFFSLFQGRNLTPNIHAQSSNQEVVRTMVANGYGFTIANARPKSVTALDGRPLTFVRLAGDHQPMTIGVATLAQEIKPRLLSAFEQHCRETISKDHIPGMVSI